MYTSLLSKLDAVGMDAFIETLEVSIMKEIIRKFEGHSGVLFNEFIIKGTKPDIIRIFKLLDQDKRDKFLISIFIENKNAEEITKMLEMVDLHDYAIKCIKTQEQADLLFASGLDLDKVISIACDIECIIVKAVVKQTLKKPFNPNRKLIVRNGVPLWRDFMDNKSLLEFIKYNGPNFSEPLDIDAKDDLGNTCLHKVQSILIKDILSFNPSVEIKNDAGFTAIEYRKIERTSISELTEYSANLLELRLKSEKEDYKVKYEALLSEHANLLKKLEMIRHSIE